MQTSVRAQPKKSTGNETVLVVEDEATVRKLTKLILEQNGYTVLEASDGLEAVQIAEWHAGPIHLLLTDLVMPGIPGRNVAEQLQSVRQGIRVLYMSGYTEDTFMRHGVESAASDFLNKPFTPSDLTSTVRKVLDRK